MERQDYGGGARYAPSQDPATVLDAAAQVDARAARRDLLFRLPPGRALDHDDLVDLLSEGNQTSRAIVMRTRLLKHVRGQLPAGVLVLPAELEHARGLEEREPARRSKSLDMPEWPAAR